HSSFMCFIKKDDRILFHIRIEEAFSQEHTICHVLDFCFRAGTVLKSNGISHLSSQSTSYLLSDAFCNRHCCNSTRLSTPDLPPSCKSLLGKILSHLRSFATSCFSDYNKQLMLLHSFNNLRPKLKNRQVFPLLTKAEVGLNSE